MKKIIFILAALLAISCSEDVDDNRPEGPKLVIKLDVDPNQVRLGNNGQPVAVAPGNGSQSPVFNELSAHYLELAPTANTLLGTGEVLYHAPETTAGGNIAIDFNQSINVTPGGTFLEIPLSTINSGSYEWVRLSLAYQNFDIQFNFNNQPFTGTFAGFVGFNTYITNFNVKNQPVTVNDDKLQGFWAFETLNGVTTGQAPPGATTVPNPLFNSSPIPQGSCVVTGQFATPLVITGTETENITVTLSLSVNQSFEWQDVNGNGKWDVDTGNEPVIDMGLRGLVPIKN